MHVWIHNHFRNRKKKLLKNKRSLSLI